MNQLMLKELNLLMDNVKYVDYSLQRIDGFPDERSVEKWFKCWRDLWKLNSISHPAPASFAGEGGEILRDMLKIFKTEYGQMIYKLDQVGITKFTAEEEYFTPDADLKQIAQPVKQRKVVEINEQGLALCF